MNRSLDLDRAAKVDGRNEAMPLNINDGNRLAIRAGLAHSRIPLDWNVSSLVVRS